MHIAVCDDDLNDLCILTELLNGYDSSNTTAAQYRIANSPRATKTYRHKQTGFTPYLHHEHEP